MSLYTVTAPCVIGQLHYATVPPQPIEIDDELAAPLVEAGSLVPYRAAVSEADDAVVQEIPTLVQDAGAEVDGQLEDPPTEKQPRGRRRATED